MASFHVRSTSFPSKSHPLTVCFEEQLNKLQSSETLSVGQKLGGLKELYECVDCYLQCFSRDNNSQSIEKAVNGSVKVLDMCSTSRDFISQIKEAVQGLESSLRRARSDAKSSLIEVDSYLSGRKKMKEAISKYLRNLKRQDKNCRTTTETNLLREAEELSVSVFELIISSVSQSNAKSKLSIISKLLQSKKVSCEVETEANEVENIDAELKAFKSSKDINQVNNILKGLVALQQSLQEVEEELDCIYRRLVKTRVSLLNILNH